DNPMNNVSSLRWLLIISGRGPKTLRSLLLMGKGELQTSSLSAGSLEIPKIDILEYTADAADRRVAELIAALKFGKNWGEQDRAAQKLIDIGSPAVEPLISELMSTDKRTKVRIVRMLGAIRDRRSVYPLAECLRDPDREIRERAADALGKIGDPRARLALMKAQRDGAPAVKAAVKRALEELREEH
ncbi:MAG: HEAT repeat domain-containing protein, partial [Methanoculleus sp.]|nr:HEAT repeat domain-containing protein [Methanoculleus sp.]